MPKAPAPRVSIIIPVYNADAYLESSFGALLGQTFRDFELIAVNDCSSDASLAMLEKMAKVDARVKVVNLEENGGSARANNVALGLAKGEYIAYTDADDISEPTRLEKQVAYLDAHKEIGLTAVQYWRLAADGESRRKTHNALDDVVLKFQLLFAVPVCHPTIVYRREFIVPMLPDVYDATRKVAADHPFFHRMAKVCRFAVLPDYLFNYRIHAGGTGAMKKEMATNNIIASSKDYALETLPRLAKEWARVEGFIKNQRRHDAMDGAGLKAYLDGLETLRAAYVATLASDADKRKVNGFCCELEAKTLLGRQKIFKQPKLLLQWILSPKNHLRFAPAMICGLVRR